MEIRTKPRPVIRILAKTLNYSGGSKGGAGDVCPPRGQNSFDFMQFLGNFGEIVCWCPPGELAPPPWGNPGSTTELEISLN